MTSHEKAILARVPAARFSCLPQRPLADDDRAARASTTTPSATTPIDTTTRTSATPAPAHAWATHFPLHSPHPTH